MSRIKNADPIKRGSSLSSTQINQQFTEVNAAFPMDGDNVRNEGIDQPVWDLNNGHGKSGIILVAADKNDNTTPVTATANSALDPESAPFTIQTWTLVQPVTTADVIRVYWQFDYQTVVSDSYPVATIGKNGCVWGIWLEYQDTFGGSWQSVPNQGDFANAISGTPGSPTAWGSHTYNTYGCTIVPHALVLHDASYGGTKVWTNPVPHTGYGDWIYTPPSNITIYGLRLQIRGLLDRKFDSVIGSPSNAWRLLVTSSGVQTNTVSRSHMAYLVMRKQ